MRIVLAMVGVGLLLLSAFAFIEGGMSYMSAKSAFHQIYAAVVLVLAAVSLSGGAVVIGVASLIEQGSAQKERVR